MKGDKCRDEQFATAIKTLIVNKVREIKRTTAFVTWEARTAGLKVQL